MFCLIHVNNMNKNVFQIRSIIRLAILFLMIESIICSINPGLIKEEKHVDSYKKLCVDQQRNFVKQESYSKNINESLVACATYYESEGWHVFNVENTLGNKFDNKLISFSAGMLEGYIYHQLIDYHYTNIFSTIMNRDHFSNRTLDYVYKQYKYVEDMVEEFEKFENRIYLAENYFSSKFLKLLPEVIRQYFITQAHLEYLETLSLILNQYKGLYHGYKLASAGKEKIISEDDFYFLTMQGDLEDILIAFDAERFEGKMWKKDKDCSGFVKFVKETNNLIVGHNTHNHYSLMNRIYKNYRLNFVLSTGKSLNNFKFSSRPGDLNSKDDYYVLSNNMVVIETSLEIVDLSIYKNLRYDTIPKWIRANIANRLASNNLEWIDLFFEENSGTHNNQWLIVDYNKFDEYIGKVSKVKNNNSNLDKYISETFYTKVSKLNSLQHLEILDDTDYDYRFQIIPKDIVHIVEQIPILDMKYYKDMSEVLINQTYVASYNSPYFEDVIKEIGYSTPPYTDHDYFHARRFYLFNQLQANVTDISTAKAVLRFHSKEDICDTIGARCDMIRNTPFGAVDVKITDSKLVKDDQTSEIIYGPPFIAGVSLPFDFVNFPNVPHLGIPDKINFDWIFA